MRSLIQIPSWETLEWPELCEAIPSLVRVKWSPQVWTQAMEAAQTLLDVAKADEVQVLTLADSAYPPLLKDTDDAPSVLYVKGDLRPALERPLAIIGTREPTEHGAVIAQRISAHFAAQGWSIISGLALGVDSLAHRAALDQEGHTVAVLAHGLHTVAPKKHTRLAEQILESGGALVTEYPHGTEPRGHQYVQRDRIQAGLARATVLVQSAFAGGSMHASRASLRYGRWLAFPVPTARDRQMQAPKIEVPILLLEGTEEEKMALLKSDVDALKRVVALHSKDDYIVLSNKLSHTHEDDYEQPGLFV